MPLPYNYSQYQHELKEALDDIVHPTKKLITTARSLQASRGRAMAKSHRRFSVERMLKRIGFDTGRKA